MSYNPNSKTEADSAFEYGMIVGSPQKVDEDGAPYIVRPTGSIVESLEQFLPLPTRARQTVHLHTPESFIRYVKAFAEGSTVIFFNESCNTFAAIIDYHGHQRTIELSGPDLDAKEPPASHPQGDSKANPGSETSGPRWCEHRAIYSALATDEWTLWTGSSGRAMNQINFARFIEDHISDIDSKDREIIQAVALNLIIKVNVVFNSAQVLQNGSTSLMFSEEVEGTTRTGQIKIPASFHLEIAPFHGSAKLAVECRFRYRFDNRTASLWYEIAGAPEIVKDAISEIYEDIATKTKVPILAGVPS